MKLDRWLASLVLAPMLLGAAAHAQQPPPTPAPKTAPAATAESAPTDAAKPTAADKPGAKVPAGTKPTPQRFEPTEKVRPDFDVAFPVDI
jgi:hypothetical protein